MLKPIDQMTDDELLKELFDIGQFEDEPEEEEE